MVLVDSDEVCAAMKDLFENVRAIAEPSGALGLAGLKKYVKQNNLEGKNMAANFIRCQPKLPYITLCFRALRNW